MREDGTLAKLFAEFGIEGPEATGGASAQETPSAP
jgi:hypothetical protein